MQPDATLWRRIASRHVLDLLALVSSRGGAHALTIVVGLILVRWMADAVFGAYSLATTTIGLLGVFIDFGLDPIVTRTIAADPTTAGAASLLRRTIVIRLTLTAVLVPLVTIVAGALATIGRADLLLVGGFSLAPRGVLRAVAATLVGFGQVRRSALIETIAVVTTSLSTLILVGAAQTTAGDAALAAMWALVIGQILGAATAADFARRLSAGTSIAAAATSACLASDLFSLVREALPFLAISLAAAFYGSVEVYLARTLYTSPSADGPDAVALYAAPLRVVTALMLVPTAWGVVLLPRYVRYSRRPPVVRLALRRDLWRGLLMGFGLAVPCTLLAGPLTSTVLGPAYGPAAPVLAALAWMAVPVGLSTPLLALLTALRLGGRIIVSVVGAGLLAIALNIAWDALSYGRGSDVIADLLALAAIKTLATAVLALSYWLHWRWWPRPAHDGRAAAANDEPQTSSRSL